MHVHEQQILWGGLLIQFRKADFVLSCNKNGQSFAADVILGDLIDPRSIEFLIRQQRAQLAEREFDALFKKNVDLMPPAIQAIANKRLSLEEKRLHGAVDCKRPRQ